MKLKILKLLVLEGNLKLQLKILRKEKWKIFCNFQNFSSFQHLCQLIKLEIAWNRKNFKFKIKLIRKEILKNFKNFQQKSHTDFNLVSTYSKNLIHSISFKYCFENLKRKFEFEKFSIINLQLIVILNVFHQILTYFKAK